MSVFVRGGTLKALFPGLVAVRLAVRWRYEFAFVGGPVVQFSGLVWPDEKRVSEPPAHLIFGVASRRAAVMSVEFRAAVKLS
ncbi:MAG: hypothetical protein ACK5TX_15085, partial [Planctomyces sp.]